MAHRGDPAHSLNNVFFRGESDWITYHTVVSTSPDQIAIAPGYLQRQWQADGRNFFEYSMGSTHILDFSPTSPVATKASSRSFTTVPAEIVSRSSCIHDPAHTYDLDDMLASSRAGLDYYQRIYSPFQFTQFRILEFPRYRTFAQSFPNTVPYSEAIGFIGRIKKPHRHRLHLLRYCAAELGHQWWAHHARPAPTWKVPT